MCPSFFSSKYRQSLTFVGGWFGNQIWAIKRSLNHLDAIRFIIKQGVPHFLWNPLCFVKLLTEFKLIEEFSFHFLKKVNSNFWAQFSTLNTFLTRPRKRSFQRISPEKQLFCGFLDQDTHLRAYFHQKHLFRRKFS